MDQPPRRCGPKGNERNITVSIDLQVYCDVRLWCARRGVSVSHVEQVFLEDLNRLEKVGRFPLPPAPDPDSLASLFDTLEPDEAFLMSQDYPELVPPSPTPCEPLNL
jgi:hypothetical protein